MFSVDSSLFAWLLDNTKNLLKIDYFIEKQIKLLH